MLVDTTFANFSDLAYKTALLLYIAALVVSLIYYATARLVDELRSSRAAALNAAKGQASAEATAPRDGAADESALDPRLQAANILKRSKRADTLGGITQALVWVAIAVHLTHTITRGLATGRIPFANLFEYIMTISLAAMVISAIFINRKSMRIMWPWVLTPIVALIFYAGTALYAASGPLVPALNSYWFNIHVSTVSIGGSVGLISGVFSVMYLIRRAYEERTATGTGTVSRPLAFIASPLPDASKLDALAYRTAVWALPIFGLGIIFGAIWADAAWGRFWGWDPKETVSFITWIMYAAFLHARATPGIRRHSAWINVLAFGTMVFNLFFINMVVSGLHSYAGLN